MNKDILQLYTGICFTANYDYNIQEKLIYAQGKKGGDYLFNNYFSVRSDMIEVIGNAFLKELRDNAPPALRELLKTVFGNNVLTFSNVYLYNIDNNELIIKNSNNFPNFRLECLADDFEFIARYGNRSINKNLFLMIKGGFTGNWNSFSEGSGRAAVLSQYYTPILNMIYSSFYKKWSDLYKTLTDYDYLKPFSISLNESSTDELTTSEDSTEYTDNDQIYAFNSIYPSDTNKATGNSNRAYSRSNPKTREYSRVGNIGNQSYAELSIKEREKAKFILKDVIFEDIASLILYDTYND